jgi:biotin carboxyl carrier protein
MKVKVNQQYNFDLEAANNTLIFDGNAIDLDSRQLSDGKSHLIFDNRSYSIEIVSVNPDEKVVEVKVNGNSYEVVIEDEYDRLLKKMGLDNGQTTRVTEVRAPMPGLVLSVAVEEGAEVKKGDTLLILEAMKMENVIRALSSGVVKAIKINKGDKVEKNQVLIEFE